MHNSKYHKNKDQIKKLVCVLIFLFAFFSLTGFKQLDNINSMELGIVYEDNGADTYILGDSRVVYMRNSVQEAKDFNWIGVCGSGIERLTTDMKAVISNEDLKGKTIIVESGLNDILFNGGAPKTYLYYYQFYNTIAQDWIKRGAKVKMIKILPVMSDNENNRIIKCYNDVLQANIPNNIDVVDLNQVTLSYIDELHFDNATSMKLYYLLIQNN